MWNSIVSVPDHCLFIYFSRLTSIGLKVSKKKKFENINAQSERSWTKVNECH